MSYPYNGWCGIFAEVIISFKGLRVSLKRPRGDEKWRIVADFSYGIAVLVVNYGISNTIVLEIP